MPLFSHASKNGIDDEKVSDSPQQDTSDARLEELGYKPQFHRDMSLFGVLGISFCAIGILTGMSSAFQTGLFSGGPLGLFWGWNICSLFMFFIALSLAEICSAYPTMGGLYFWVCRMKPDSPFLGFCTGWIYCIAMIFTGISGNLSSALYISSLASMSPSAPQLTRWQITFVAWGVLILSGIINTFGTKAINWMSKINLWWTICGTGILVGVLLGTTDGDKNSAKFVFTDYENFTGYSSRGFVVLLGFLQAVYTLEGCETAAQLAEETTRAAILSPLAILSSIVGSYIIGLAYLLSLLFCLRNISRRKLSILCLVVVGVAQFMAAVTAFTASSRLFYALARDDGTGRFGKRWFMKLNRYQAPWVGVWLSVFVGCAIVCAYIGSVVAFNAILSSAAISVMLSYMMPILIRVFWFETSLPERGPFTLGRFSFPINLASFLFSLFVSVLFILPTAHPVTSTNMNYAIVAIGGIIVLVGIAWFAWGRQSFKSRRRVIIENELRMLRIRGAGKLDWLGYRTIIDFGAKYRLSNLNRQWPKCTLTYLCIMEIPLDLSSISSKTLVETKQTMKASIVIIQTIRYPSFHSTGRARELDIAQAPT
ncbi:Amino Acid-Polyamine-Organocation Transporter [Abortiporus biennis]